MVEGSRPARRIQEKAKSSITSAIERSHNSNLREEREKFLALSFPSCHVHILAENHNLNIGIRERQISSKTREREREQDERVTS